MAREVGVAMPARLAAAVDNHSFGTNPHLADRLRVLFVTEDDPLYVIRLFEVFFREFLR